MGESIRILFLAADPSDLTRVRLAAEFQVIRDELQRGRWGGLFVLEPMFSVQVRDMSRAVKNFRPHLIHFCGHGSVDGELVFEDPKEEARRVRPEDLEAFFARLAGRVDAVVLNACYSEKQAVMISKYVPYTIGIRGLVSDPAAICFARGFYQSLSAQGGLDGAFEDACAFLRAEGFSDSVELVLQEGTGAGKTLVGPWGERTGSESRATVTGRNIKAVGNIVMSADPGSVDADGLEAGRSVKLKGRAR